MDEHHVHVYASKSNDGTILKAPRPKDLFRNSIAPPALVASIINGKYTNALPLERQAKTFKTNGIQLSTNTMANWVIKSTDVYLSLIYDHLHELIYDSKVIYADESPVKVMRIDHTKIKNGKKTYMWVYRNRPLRGTHPSSFSTGSLPAIQTIHGNSLRLSLEPWSLMDTRSTINSPKSAGILKSQAAGSMPEDLLRNS